MCISEHETTKDTGCCRGWGSWPARKRVGSVVECEISSYWGAAAHVTMCEGVCATDLVCPVVNNWGDWFLGTTAAKTKPATG